MKKHIGENLIDRTTLGVFGLLSGGLNKKAAGEQYEQNAAAWEANAPSSYIEHQSELTWLKYGKANTLEKKLFFNGRELTAAENACEVIAVYNALLALEAAHSRQNGRKRKHRTLPELLYRFSQKGICAGGVFGTSPKALEHFFLSHNYRCTSLRGKQITEEAVRELQELYDAFIMTAFNEGQNPFHMVHTMCITKEQGGFQRHNDYASPRICDTLYDALQTYRNGRGHTIFVLAVGNLKEKTNA